MTMRLIPKNPGRATFCLNMIVKNEAHVIERCLDSVLPMLDFVRIIDTGSTDDTVHLIRSWCLNHGINCIVKSSEWKDFATNRNEALQLAGECEASHLVLIDADEILHITPEEVRELRKRLAVSDNELFSIPMLHGNNVCTRTTLTRNLPKRLVYHYPIHEELILDGDDTKPLTLIANPADYTKGPHLTTPQDGARSQGQDRLGRDLIALKKAHDEDKNPRHIFYSAQVLRIAAHENPDPDLWAMVRETYTDYLRAMNGNWKPHCYVAALWVSRIMEMEGRPADKVIESYLRVHDFDPGRPEAMGCLANLCLEIGQIEKAREYAERVETCRGSSNYAFLETKWYQRAKDILAQLNEVKAC